MSGTTGVTGAGSRRRGPEAGANHESRGSVAGSAVGVAAIVLAASAVGADCLQYDITVIPEPACSDGTTASGYAVNDLGHVVGEWHCLTGHPHAFVWHGEGALETLPFPPGTFLSVARDINEDGWIVGYFDPPDTHEQGFLFADGALTPLGFLPGGMQSEADALNERGVIAGSAKPAGSELWHACTWTDGIIRDINPDLGAVYSRARDINDRGQVVGYMTLTPTGSEIAFLWDNGTLVDIGLLPGGTWTEANAVNNDGWVIGDGTWRPHEGAPAVTRGFLWRDGEITILDPLPGWERSTAADINDAGEIVGYSFPGNRPTLWVRGGPPIHLNELLPANAGIVPYGAYGVNGLGQITGTGYGGVFSSYLMTPVPAVPGDVDCDRTVGFRDLLAVLSNWGPCSECPSDLDGDGGVGGSDVLIVLENWG